MLTGVDPPLDGAVVLLEPVVQIWHWPMPAILGENTFGFELRDGGRIRGVVVGVDDSWRGMVRTASAFTRKRLGRDRVLLSREEKIQGRSARVHRPVEVTPLPFTRTYVSSQAPAVIGGLELTAADAPACGMTPKQFAERFME